MMKYKVVKLISDTEILLLSEKGEFNLFSISESGDLKIHGITYAFSKTLTSTEAFRLLKIQTHKTT